MDNKIISFKTLQYHCHVKRFRDFNQMTGNKLETYLNNIIESELKNQKGKK